MTTDRLTPDLEAWDAYAKSINWQGLLIGNGMSRAVWERFSYPSLYEVARSVDVGRLLTAEDQELFARLGGTRNFEAVLGALLTTQTIAEALDLQPHARVGERYTSIQQALIGAVHHVHVPWNSVPDGTLQQICTALLEYDYVYSTNYDLLVYWSMMAGETSRFKDYFWGTVFDPSDTAVWGSATRVLFLHGGLHLYYEPGGRTYKERAEPFANLLAIFGRRPDAVPLCITEGTASQKMAAIARSDYLSFAYQQFGQQGGPLVILGHALGEMDRHISDALARDRRRQSAVGIYPVSDAQVIREKAYIVSLLPEAHLLFFDSRTHPITLPSHRVPSTAEQGGSVNAP